MRDKILEIIETKPKHYTVLIKKDPVLLDWVINNSLTDTDHFPTKVYSAIHQVSMTCEQGKTKTITRWNQPVTFCGHASVCICNKEATARKVSETKLSKTPEENNRINTKRKEKMQALYGVDYNSQRLEKKQVWSKPKVSSEAYDKLTNKNWMHEQYVINQRSLVDIADELGVYYSTVGHYCNQHGFKIRKRSNYSLVEIKISEFVKSLGEDPILGDWDILKTHELDIVIPNKNFAIEVNGLYWHSFHPKTGKIENSKKHLEKHNLAKENSIDLFQVTDWEWLNKQDIIKSMIKAKLGYSTKIFARKTKIIEVTRKQAKEFLSKNHLQGYIPSEQYLGLVYNNELVMMITLGKNRFSKSSDYELHRLCSKQGISVVGGASKLLKYAKEKIKTPVLSYCDMSKSNGQGYITMGFELVKTTGPGYFWTDGNEIFSRYMCQKKKLQKWLKTYDPGKTESQNMFDSGYRRYYDCGNYVFKLK